MISVTFDTNALDKACRPERFPKDSNQAVYQKVHDALKAGNMAGYYSVTMLTIEGIQNADRAKVFSGTKLTTSTSEETITSTRDLHPDIRAKIGNDDITTISLNITVSQPDRAPLHPEVLRRVKAAHGLGVKVLKAPPRFGAFSYDDPDGKFYLPIMIVGNWLNGLKRFKTLVLPLRLGVWGMQD
ncbi:hypothetical protein JCM17844_28540 [Iodidimonas gelatinilytica]|uniref:Uncharacterized protein n=1 Tax=Iodidimonas gelatinilytica TaxID=1236966 RepID=A0A5A7MTE2_9PROT|nr:hypothetical protein [Iodidimonas gelatinilytica]GEQ99217.1 hypothetical protein JCM17844_28540 [Iodidimonas gelatinilytica]